MADNSQVSQIIATEKNILILSQDLTKSSTDLQKEIRKNKNIKSIHQESDLIKYFYD